MKRILTFAAAATILAACTTGTPASVESYSLSSPDGQLKATFTLTDGVPR